MARNDYMQAPVRMKARTSWTGREGKITKGDIIDVPEWRARQLEGYMHTQSPRMGLDGSRVEAGQPYHGPQRAVRISPDEIERKGGPRPDDRKGDGKKEHQPADTERKDEPDAPPAERPDATESAAALADSLGVDLVNVKGSGASGRITKPDVQAYHEARPRTGDAHLDQFVTDLRELTPEQLDEQREVYAQESDKRYVDAVDREIAAREAD